MAWVLLIGLAWVTSASAVRYTDYSGVKVPQYGSNEYDTVRGSGQVVGIVEDYQGHSPDASSSLDYKYEGERHSKSEKPIIESEDVVNWNKPVRKHRELLKPPADENNIETNDKYEHKSETATKFKANRRFLKHKSRLKKRNFNEEEETSSRWSVKNIHSKKYNRDVDINDFNLDDYNERHDEIPKLDANLERYRQHEITERVIRRRPRDRLFNRIRPNIERPSDEIELGRKIKDERRMNLDYMLEDEDRGQRRKSYKPFQDEEEDQESRESDMQKSKTFEDYGDYYDMKRVHNIKSKLPTLLRRPTARMDTTVAASLNEMETLWTLRRKNAPVSMSQAFSPFTLSTGTSPEISSSTTLNPISTSELSKEAPEQLSLAEKSKLSIMKKAQRKESLRMDMLSKKPPVLLQVTNKMLTVVVVEPPTSAAPWMRASILVHDTPERLERAKKLMRNKLVARARDIHELTDNWDEVICDYIDVSLLDGVPQTNRHYVMYITEILLLFVLL